jgi:hypothetical protein
MLDRLAAANPAPEHGLDIDDSTLLLAIRERSVDMSTNTEHQATRGTPPPTSPQSPRRRSGWVAAVAAFAVVVAAGIAVVLVTSTGTVSEQDVVDTPPTTAVTPTTQAQAQISVVEALAIKDAYIAAANAGNTDAVLALFEPDSGVFVGDVTTDLDTFERYLVFSIAQGMTVTARGCTTEPIENAIRLRCESSRHQYLAKAVGAPAAEGTLTLTISAVGISLFVESFNSDFDQALVNVPFDRWLKGTHPEVFDARVSFGTWDSIAEAEQEGILRALYADEWAAHLDTNGCTYQESDC